MKATMCSIVTFFQVAWLKLNLPEVDDKVKGETDNELVAVEGKGWTLLT